MDYLDRLAIPIPEHPIAESTLKEIVEYPQYHIAIAKRPKYVQTPEASTLASKIAQDRFVEYWDVMAERVHAQIKAKGGADDDRNDGEMIALMHAELSEALEALRNGDPPSEKIPGFSSLEEELADEVTWIMGYSKMRGLRVGEAVVAKHAFNTTRPRKHGKKF